jgi:hypothetical protein
VRPAQGADATAPRPKAPGGQRGFILAGDDSAAYVERPGDTTLTDQRQLDIGTDLHRRRASDRARERAGRAAWLGDRAGLLIATSAAVALMSTRTQSDLPPGRHD